MNFVDLVEIRWWSGGGCFLESFNLAEQKRFDQNQGSCLGALA